ncbi:MAG TPA: DUF4124 domain-containing protein [Nevskiaceae bacterium]|nr:DUF4124 domain-containing protein [Nevskiaceae bacterium]
MARWLPLLFLFACANASANIYRCERGGKLVFSDRACEAGQVAIEITTPNVLETSSGDRELARAFDARTTSLQATRARALVEARASDEKAESSAPRSKKGSKRASTKRLKAPKQPTVHRTVEKPAQLAPRR